MKNGCQTNAQIRKEFYHVANIEPITPHANSARMYHTCDEKKKERSTALCVPFFV